MRPSPSEAPEGGGSGVSLPPGRSITFNITLLWEVINRLGCDHLSEYRPDQPDRHAWFSSALLCRSCSLTWEAKACLDYGDIVNLVSYQSAAVGRRVTGIAVTDRGRMWVSRMLAVAQFHRDPVELMLSEGREAELDAMGTLIPTWAQAAVYMRQQLASGALQANT